MREEWEIIDVTGENVPEETKAEIRERLALNGWVALSPNLRIHRIRPANVLADLRERCAAVAEFEAKCRSSTMHHEAAIRDACSRIAAAIRALPLE